LFERRRVFGEIFVLGNNFFKRVQGNKEISEQFIPIKEIIFLFKKSKKEF